jgi:tRNA modification GTPase
MDDTIFALSSGLPPAGVAVIRISGAKAFEAVWSLAGALPAPRLASLRSIRDRNGLIIDQALLLTFPAPNSFTGEDCAEFHVHGSRAVVAAVYAALGTMPGLRLAEAGEFSRRAFENGRMDLVEAEGLADLIAAETEMQRRLAVEQSFGGQSALYTSWAERLTKARALIEAELDFADEEDVPGSVSDLVWSDMAALQREIDEHARAADGGEIIRDGFKVVIGGPPNAGKSSLLNCLASRDVAIVTDIAGTTRDVLSVDLDIDGYLVRFFDTAGLHDSTDVVEREGIRRAAIAAEQADLILELQDIDSMPKRIEWPTQTPVMRIGTKSDLNGDSEQFDLCISTKTRDGLEELRRLIAQRVSSSWSGVAVPNRRRQLDLIKETSNFVAEALRGGPLDLRAESLRSAASALGRITGRVDVEQLLDVIFSQFCIGK